MKQQIFISIFLLLTITAYCQHNTIDQTFGEKGFVKTIMSEGANFFKTGKAAALQADGKILISGRFTNKNRPEIIRYMPDGKVDSSFGENGIAGIDSFSVVFSPGDIMVIKSKKILPSIEDMAVLPDGKIVVAGNLSGINQPFAARFMPGGAIDTSFAIKGVFTDQFLSDFDAVRTIAIQNDGRLLLAGGVFADEDGSLIGHSSIYCFRVNGSFDSSFGINGKKWSDTSLETVMKNSFYNNAIAVQPDGKIVTAGYQNANMFRSINFVVNRYNADGTPDAAFGNSGTTITKTKDYNDKIENIIIQPDGKIIIGGYSATNRDTYMMTALRYTAKGKLDKSFGRKGKVTVLFEDKLYPGCRALLEPIGKIVLVGSVFTKTRGDEDFALCRINKNGSLDNSFGIGGKQVITSEKSKESFQSALLQPDGKIITIGYSYYNSELTAVLLRCNGN